MHRVKAVGYDADDLYSDGEDDYAEQPELTFEDRDNFATLTPVVRAELEEAGLEASNKEIEDVLWDAYWDVAQTVSQIKDVKAKRLRQQQEQAVKKAQGKPKSKFELAAERSAVKAGTKQPKLSTNGTTKDQSVQGLESQTENLALDASQPREKVQSKGLDVPALWEAEQSTRKPSAAFVVIGHVDHGKSTLMGRLLLDTGAVSQRDVDKYQKQATDIGKSSFALAWILDTGEQERTHGVTTDIATHPFSTSSTSFTILDAPGHRDFVPNMLAGASMADIAVLVVDANQLESGMKGQTREHVLLAKAAGLKQIIVAINKMDTTTPENWSETAFTSVSVEVGKFLQDAGFAGEDIAFVPCSGLGGANVVKSGDISWIAKSHPTLLQQLERFAAQLSSISEGDRTVAVKGPLRMQIADVFRGSNQNPLSIAGRIERGNVQTGDVILVQPSGETATIRGIEVGNAGETRDWVVAGEIVTLHLADIEARFLRAGDIVCNPSHPISVVKAFTLRIEALDALLPMPLEVNLGGLQAAGKLSQLSWTLAPDGGVLKKKPRMIKAGQSAVVKVTTEEGVPIGNGERVVLRTRGATVAVGVVEGVGS